VAQRCAALASPIEMHLAHQTVVECIHYVLVVALLVLPKAVGTGLVSADAVPGEETL
jgi:hypothetical protein